MSSHSHGLGRRSKLTYAPGCGPMGISAPTFGAGGGGGIRVLNKQAQRTRLGNGYFKQATDPLHSPEDMCELPL